MRHNLLHYIVPAALAILATAPATANNIIRIAGNGSAGYSGNGGAAVAAQLNNPTGVCVDGAGNMYIADRENHVVRKINNIGVITTVAGTGTAGYSIDGVAATSAQLNKPGAVICDMAGNLYISETGNNRILVVRASGIVTTFAGSGVTGYSGNGGLADTATFNAPEGITFDANWNMYVADAGNHVIRKIDGNTHVVTTVAGSGVAGYAGDGGVATLGRLYQPSAVAVDALGSIYVADVANHAIRKVQGGLISTVAGNGTIGSAGDGGPAAAATLRYPSGVATDMSGNVYVADQGNNTVRMISATTGIINRTAGTGAIGDAGDGGAALDCQMNSPRTVVVDGIGRVLVADLGNHSVRAISMTAEVTTNKVSKGTVAYPNPANNTLLLTVPMGEVHVTMNNVLGQTVKDLHVTNSAGNIKVDVGDLATGSYLLVIDANGQRNTHQVTVIR